MTSKDSAPDKQAVGAEDPEMEELAAIAEKASSQLRQERPAKKKKKPAKKKSP